MWVQFKQSLLLLYLMLSIILLNISQSKINNQDTCFSPFDHTFATIPYLLNELGVEYQTLTSGPTPA